MLPTLFPKVTALLYMMLCNGETVKDGRTPEVTLASFAEPSDKTESPNECKQSTNTSNM